MADRSRPTRRKSPERPIAKSASKKSSFSPSSSERQDKIDFSEQAVVPTGDTPKSQLEAERALLQKSQRANDRLVKRLEELAVRSATKEAEYRLKVISFSFFVLFNVS